MHVLEEKVTFSIKNVSERSLALENSNAGDLTERFIRGDASRTTEGSGLGLSIAKSLTQLMGGIFSSGWTEICLRLRSHSRCTGKQ